MALTIIHFDYDYSAYPDVTDNTSGVTKTPEDIAAEQDASNLLIGNSDLLPTLIHCYLIIFLGYISGKLKVISINQIKGLLSFLNVFALPALVFGGLVNMEIEAINWTILACIFLAKIIVFVTVIGITLNLTRPSNVPMAGLYGIFVTDSNDFALGFPLLLSSHFKYRSVFLSYLYLVEPIRLMTLNPVALIMMDFPQSKGQKTLSGKIPKLFSKALGYAICNSLIVTTILGIVGNALFRNRLPVVITRVMEILGTSFPAVSLFILGRLFAVNYNILRRGSLVVPGLLIAAKNLLLPSLIWKLIQLLLDEETELEMEDACSFGFLYGTFPTGFSVLLHQTPLDAATDVVTIGAVGSTLVSAVLTFLVNSMTFISTSRNAIRFNRYVLNTLGSVSTVGALCCLWVLSVLIAEKRWTFAMRRIQFLIVVSQLLVSSGGMLRAFIALEPQWVLHVHYLLSTGGLFSVRIWASLFAVLLALLQWKGLYIVLRLYKYVLAIGAVSILGAVISFFIQIRSTSSYEDGGDDRSSSSIREQLYVVFIVIVVSLFVSVGALLVHQHYCIKSSNFGHAFTHEVEDRYVEDNKFEISKCVIFLLSICFCTAVSFTVCLWKIVMEDIAGVYSELVILDTTLNYGQGIFSFFVLGLDDKLVIEPCLQFLDRVFGNVSSESSSTDLSPISGKICDEFAPHATKCKEDICTEQRVGDRLYKSSFRGKQLVDWLMFNNLTHDRTAAEMYGQHLLLGGLISHVGGSRKFRDDLFLYVFTNKIDTK